MWPAPAPIHYGTALGPEHLGATASVPGQFLYSPQTGTVLHAGLHVLNATFVPGEAVPIHAAWAEALESRTGTAIDELRRVGELASHYESAHDRAASLDASLRAADLSSQLKAQALEKA